MDAFHNQCVVVVFFNGVPDVPVGTRCRLIHLGEQADIRPLHMGNRLPQRAAGQHGKGTGVLRKAVHEILRRNKAVKSFRLGVYGEGETGVTVVSMWRLRSVVGSP